MELLYIILIFIQYRIVLYSFLAVKKSILVILIIRFKLYFKICKIRNVLEIMYTKQYIQYRIKNILSSS